jgi:predicted nuclease of predicted toxin-antitoxin system
VRFKVDHNLPVEVVDELIAAGHDAVSVLAQGLAAAADSDIVEVCQREGRILMTADLDLSDIRQYPPAGSPGFIVLRLHRQSRPAQLALLRQLMPQLAARAVADHLWIAEPGRIRVRGGGSS